MMVAKRNLFVTLRMLSAAGIDAGASLIDEQIHVYVRNPERGEPPLTARFEGSEIVRAADWLAACVVHCYPKSDLAKVWSVLLTASATLPR
jgi:hypothetical protein